MDVGLLIEYVRENEQLYNISLREYRNPQARKEAWDEIGTKLGFSGIECKETWTKLRNSHTNARKRRENAGLSGHNLSEWRYEEEMSFLLPNYEGLRKRNENEETTIGETIENQSRNEIDLELLIEYVREHEVLYNVSHKDYRNLQARKDVWDLIGSRLDISGAECKETWTKLRNSHTNARKRRETASGQSLTEWRFDEQMAFLLPTYEKRKKIGNIKIKLLENEINTDNIRETVEEIRMFEEIFAANNNSNTSTPQTVEDLNQQPQILTHPPISQSPPNRHRPEKRRLIESSMCEMVNIMKEYSSINSHFESQANVANDDTELFFLSLGRNVKKLCRAEQAKVKMEISNAVFQAELRDIQRSESDSSVK